MQVCIACGEGRIKEGEVKIAWIRCKTRADIYVLVCTVYSREVFKPQGD